MTAESKGRVILTREQWLLVKPLFRNRPNDPRVTDEVERPAAEVEQ